MIKEVCGDILSVTQPDDGRVVICHQVNCCGVMGSGLAKQVKDKFPIAFKNYKELCINLNDLLGRVQFVKTDGSNNVIIANCFAQQKYGTLGTYTNYNALESCLKNIQERVPEKYTIRIPYKIGCGLGGGDWRVVLPIIERVFSERTVEVWRLPYGYK